MRDEIHYTQAAQTEDGNWRIDVLGAIYLDQEDYDRLTAGESIQIKIVRGDGQ
jgi:hypothetical protein